VGDADEKQGAAFRFRLAIARLASFVSADAMSV